MPVRSGLGVVIVATLGIALAGCGGAGRAMGPPPTPIPASDSAPSWSPDGAWIVYAHTAGSVEDAGRAGIYRVDTLGSPPVQILAGDFGYPDWSPDGRELAVTGRRDAASRGVFTMSAAGAGLTLRSNDAGYAVKWSPDGRTLAYQTYDSTRVYRLWLMDRDGTHARCLNPYGDESWFEPDWSPDSRKLTHVRLGYWLTQPEICVMDATGGVVQRLTDDGFEARYPSWSPDGRWIAWGSWQGSTAELWVMRSDGSEARKLADGYWPDWAPDSRRLVYTAPEPASGAYRVFALDLASGAVRQLTR